MSSHDQPDRRARRPTPAVDAHERIGSRLRAGAFVAVLLSLATPAAGPGFRRDEVQCEEAKARLLECCGPGRGEVRCEYEDGCQRSRPDLDEGQSEEIRRLPCDEIRRGEFCALGADRTSE